MINWLCAKWRMLMDERQFLPYWRSSCSIDIIIIYINVYGNIYIISFRYRLCAGLLPTAARIPHRFYAHSFVVTKIGNHSGGQIKVYSCDRDYTATAIYRPTIYWEKILLSWMQCKLFTPFRFLKLLQLIFWEQRGITSATYRRKTEWMKRFCSDSQTDLDPVAPTMVK